MTYNVFGGTLSLNQSINLFFFVNFLFYLREVFERRIFMHYLIVTHM